MPFSSVDAPAPLAGNPTKFDTLNMMESKVYRSCV